MSISVFSRYVQFYNENYNIGDYHATLEFVAEDGWDATVAMYTSAGNVQMYCVRLDEGLSNVVGHTPASNFVTPVAVAAGGIGKYSSNTPQDFIANNGAIGPGRYVIILGIAATGNYQYCVTVNLRRPGTV